MVGLALVVVNAFIVDMLNAFVGVIYACSQRPPSRGPSRLDRAFAGDFILEWHLRLAATFVWCFASAAPIFGSAHRLCRWGCLCERMGSSVDHLHSALSVGFGGAFVTIVPVVSASPRPELFEGLHSRLDLVCSSPPRWRTRSLSLHTRFEEVGDDQHRCVNSRFGELHAAG